VSRKRIIIQGDGEVVKQVFSYLSTNVSKTMTRNDWPQNFVDSMTKFIKFETRVNVIDGLTEQYSSFQNIRFDESKLLTLLSATPAELSEWATSIQNLNALVELLNGVLKNGKFWGESTDWAWNTSCAYFVRFAALAKERLPKYDDAQLNTIRPLYLLYALNESVKMKEKRKPEWYWHSLVAGPAALLGPENDRWADGRNPWGGI